MAMADFTCTTSPLLLYPFIILILFISSINHHFHFFPCSHSHSHHSPSNDNHPPISPENTRNIFQPNSNPTPDSDVVVDGGRGVEKGKKKSPFERMEEGLARARAVIKAASRSRSYTSNKVERFVPRGSVYINSHAFHQSHVEMEKRFRVWPYREGEPPLFHEGPMADIYSIEGQLIDELVGGKSPFLARNPNEAIVYFVPISITNIIRFVYRPYTNYSRDRLQNIVKDYIGIVSSKYPYWNRSSGADHFLVSCHDWAPDVSAADPKFYQYFIRVLCNANSSEGFRPAIDVSMPEIYLNYGLEEPPKLSRESTNRSILAFFAGGAHGDIRNHLFAYWKEKDVDVCVYEYLPETLNYTQLMGQSKFCLCPSGYEVASPRIVESIYSGCVPVIISDSYVLPFSDVLNWSRFSVHIPVVKIPEIKKILLGISMEEYLEKQRGVVQVQRHFVMNRPAKPYDLMHMVMHSVWLRRLNLRLPLPPPP
ncbi:hypothetical protein Ddye_006551 [Dipteronia dyeriana]|uniref:Exostosin GT47 domain-containing protein n=1 Tax=Dipteronia dyeriana TaxID=168575 RepID=A0AAD9XIN6_9ROSI|nr:hypothetical protein Ddye_006551 [Dipteronia dyeriana]